MGTILQGNSGILSYNLGPGPITGPITCLISKIGLSFGPPSAGVVTVITGVTSGNVWVSVTYDSIDSGTLGPLAFSFTPAAGVVIDPPAEEVISQTPADVNVTQWRGGTPEPLTGSGFVKVDLEEWEGVAPTGVVNGAVPANVLVVCGDSTFTNVPGVLRVDVVNYLGIAAPGLSGGGLYETDVVAWNHGGVPPVDGGGFLQVDVVGWNGGPVPLSNGSNHLLVNVVEFDGHNATGFINAGGTILLAQLDTSQPLYAPAKAGDQMDFINAPNATALTAIANAVLNTPGIDATIATLTQAVRVMLAALAGKSSVVVDVWTYRDTDDTKDRIVATTDDNGQRSVVTLDAS